MGTVQPTRARSIISARKGMDGSLQLQTPRPPKACGSAGPGTPCWDLDLRVTVLLVTVAGAVILLLLYRLLQVKHRLRVARAGQALKYYSFYHAATYTLRQQAPPQVTPPRGGDTPEVNPTAPIVTTMTPAANQPPVPLVSVSPPPPLPLPPPPVPPPFIPAAPLPPTPPLLTLPLPVPVIHNTPPSPHLSWGASSDVDVYSRIGIFRPSRVSSLSSQTQVILFEHSSL